VGAATVKYPWTEQWLQLEKKSCIHVSFNCDAYYLATRQTSLAVLTVTT